MTVHLRTSSGTKSVATSHVRTASGIKAVANGRIRTADGLETFFQSIASGGSGGSSAITVSPQSAGGGASSSSTIVINSSYVTVTVNGGTPPYAHLWSQVSGAAMTATSPTSETTNFNAFVSPGAILNAIFKDTVTDSAGVSAASPNVSVTLRNIGGSL